MAKVAPDPVSTEEAPPPVATGSPATPADGPSSMRLAQLASPGFTATPIPGEKQKNFAELEEGRKGSPKEVSEEEVSVNNELLEEQELRGADTAAQLLDRQVLLLMLLCVGFVGWLALLTAAPFAFAAEHTLNDPVVTTISIVGFFMVFKAAAGAQIDLNNVTGVRTAVAIALALVLMHAAVVCFGFSRARLTTLAGGASSLPIVEVVRIGLLYALLLAVFVAGLWIARLRRRVQVIDDEMREIHVKYMSMQHMMHRFGNGGDEDDLEESSDFEGDERETLIVPPTPEAIPSAAKGKPDLALPAAMAANMVFDRELALKIAGRIRKKGYGLQHFYDDIRKAFPELELYCASVSSSSSSGGGNGEGGDGGSPSGAATAAPAAVTSGLTSDAEYRRTIGAMFAVYWLMRIGIDGERGFSFGVDENWAPREVPATPSSKLDNAYASLGGGGLAEGSKRSASGEDKADELRRAEVSKRLAFYENQDWARLQQLLADGGLISLDDKGAVTTTNIERTVAMLALTAFHDIMKVEALLPAVAPEHAPYQNFQAGDVINDHDLALGYVLDLYPHLLPSFEGLTVSNKRSVRFTQSKMQFNHGWLVQGEAPPAPLFAKFKEVMLSGGVSPSDVAFYFVHWLTDLAGAEPSPLGGGEKFVLKFPHAVLDSFIRSFSVLNELAVKSETEVMEEYLIHTWGEMQGLVSLPKGEDGIARMRLLLQAQTPDKQVAIMQSFDDLSKDDRATLVEEMARTGVEGQTFKLGPAFKQSFGPAFLVYYSPAFVRNWANNDAPAALQVLAEVYRRARRLWPLRATSGSHHAVTIRIDQLKELKLQAILSAFAEGDTWVIVQKNEQEGVVERHSTDHVTQLVQAGTAVEVLKFHRVNREGRSHSQFGKSSNGGKSSATILSNGSGKRSILSGSNSGRSQRVQFSAKGGGGGGESSSFTRRKSAEL